MKDPCTTTSGPWPVFVQSFPPKSEFSADQIPDQSGRVVLVTGTFASPPGGSVALSSWNSPCFCFSGGNTGIGYETTKVRLLL